MSDLARFRIWDDPAIRDGLSWYLAVADNRRPAKFRIAATLPIQLDLRWPWHLGQSALTSLYRRVDEQDHHVGQQAQADARRGQLAGRSSLPALMVVVLPKAVARML